MENKPPIKPGFHKRCYICNSPHLKEINDLIPTTSQMEIARRFPEEGVVLTTMTQRISRHTKNCLNTGVSQLIQTGRAKQAEGYLVNVAKEHHDNLEFVKQLRDAARAWLEDPDHADQLTLDPRAEEVRVVYYTRNPDPCIAEIQRHSASLQELLDRLTENGDKTNVHRINTVKFKRIDMRLYALRAVDACNPILAEYAKILGLYKQDAPNPQEREMQVKQLIDMVRWAVSMANCDEVKKLHDQGENVSMEFAISTLAFLNQHEESRALFQEVRQNLLSS
jgi:hypothetical protein